MEATEERQQATTGTPGPSAGNRQPRRAGTWRQATGETREREQAVKRRSTIHRQLFGVRFLTGAVLIVFLSLPSIAGAQLSHAHSSLTDTSLELPAWSDVVRVLTLRDYNTRVVMLATSMLGLAAGLVGTFMLLRRRALMGDALSHAMLPGVGIAFVTAEALGRSGKSPILLLIGAAISGVVGLGCVLFIRQWSRLKEDAALGIVLSVFFGLGIAVLGVVQKMESGSAAGLESYIYGKTASMVARDAWLIGSAALVTVVVGLALFKEFALLCFDTDFSRAQGRPALGLDIVLMTLVCLVTVIGLQAVGLILMVALLVIPPAAARFWTHHLPTTVAASGLIGAASGFIGAGLSALTPHLPAGAVIVVVAGVIFGLSMLLGPARGVLRRAVEHHRLTRKVLRQHLLRALFEMLEGRVAKQNHEADVASFHHLLRRRSWSAHALRAELGRAQSEGLVRNLPSGEVHITPRGWVEAERVTRNHRLWEVYLITYADVAPSHVDRDADELEHVLGATLVEELERKLAESLPAMRSVLSPHVIVT